MQLSARFEEALAFAARLHRTQQRKGSGTPYVAHLLAVTALVVEHGGDEDEAIAALLHDAVEDQGGASALAEIRERFGERVAGIVDECSDTDKVPKPPWQERKEAYLARLSVLSRSAQLVAAADKLHNARSILTDYRRHGETLWDRFNGGREGTLWYYLAAAKALQGKAPIALVDQLTQVVTELKHLMESCFNPGASHPRTGRSEGNT